MPFLTDINDECALCNCAQLRPSIAPPLIEQACVFAQVFLQKLTGFVQLVPLRQQEIALFRPVVCQAENSEKSLLALLSV